MKTDKAVWFVVALALTGCSSCNNPPKSSGNNGISVPKPTPASCACNEFPYPSACGSQCFVADAQIESVNTQAGTATIKVVRGTQIIHQTISLDRLPKEVPVQAGARFKALLHTGELAEKPRITGVVK